MDQVTLTGDFIRPCRFFQVVEHVLDSPWNSSTCQQVSVRKRWRALDLQFGPRGMHVHSYHL